MGNDRCTLSTSNFFIDQPDLAPGSKTSFLLLKPRLSAKSCVPNETKVSPCKTNPCSLKSKLEKESQIDLKTFVEFDLITNKK